MNYLLTHSVLNSAFRRPDHIAFQCGTKSLTFASLADQMNQLARLLQELGVRKGECVGIYLNRSLETALAIYGIMQTGAIYVPLDPNAPPKRTQFLIEDCEIRYLISNNSSSRQLKKVVEGEKKSRDYYWG